MTHDLTFSSLTARLHAFIRGQSPGAAAADASSSGGCEAQFNLLALDLFALQYAHNPAYRRLCQARKALPLDVSHWTEIPSVPAVAFKELEMTSLCPEERTAVFHSSGTTEEKPSRQFHDAGSLALYESSARAWFGAHVLTGKWPMIFLTPAGADAPHSSLVHMFEVVRREYGADDSFFAGRLDEAGGWSLELGRLLPRLRGAVEANRPVALLGTAFNFVHLLDHLAAAGTHCPLPAGSRVMETGGYKGRSRALSRADLHKLITALLGVPASHIVCEYGMSELSSQAYERSVARAASSSSISPSPPSDGGEGRGEEVGSHGFPLTSVLSPLVPRGERKERLEQFCRGGSTGASNFEPRTSNLEPRTLHFPPWARVQIISPETGREVAEGETGLIRIFDLANVRSVLAIQTEDLGVRRADGFELLGRVASAEPRGCSLMASFTS
jgi:hypothetical protein